LGLSPLCWPKGFQLYYYKGVDIEIYSIRIVLICLSKFSCFSWAFFRTWELSFRVLISASIFCPSLSSTDIYRYFKIVPRPLIKPLFLLMCGSKVSILSSNCCSFPCITSSEILNVTSNLRAFNVSLILESHSLKSWTSTIWVKILWFCEHFPDEWMREVRIRWVFPRRKTVRWNGWFWNGAGLLGVIVFPDYFSYFLFV